MKKFYLFCKFILDELFALLVTLILLLPLIIFAIITRISVKGSIFFRQKRIGKNKKEFYILKFRSMVLDAPSETATHLLENPDQYITKWGAFMRKTGIDELPQLFNILLGQMSFIGPRPALWNQYDLVEERDKYNANSLRPGMTGLAQISGTSKCELPIDEKARFDGIYVKKISFIFDIKIFFKTIVFIIKRKSKK